MLQLESAKCSFLFCLGLSILICSMIYLWTNPADAHKAKTHKLAHSRSLNVCVSLSDTCQSLIPSSPGKRWQRLECQVAGYFEGERLNCSQMLTDLHFITQPLSKEEEDFPLAFILTIHKELEVFVRLLRAIYTPHNIYCVHVDGKAPEEYKDTVRRLVMCLPNVFLTSVSESVIYAGFSRLKADINCMSDLLRPPIRWKRVINLCGQDFPVQTNLELVRYMQGAEWRDRNMTPGVKQPTSMQYRTQLQHVEVKGTHVASYGKGHRKGPPPHNLQIYFGTAYYSLTRAFVEFVLQSSVARDLLEWSRDTYSPDEHYWVTLNHLEGIYVRSICIYGMEDLPWIMKKKSMFANKFESTRFPDALDCMELWQRHRVLQQATVPIQSSWQLATEVNAVSHFRTARRI